MREQRMSEYHETQSNIEKSEMEAEVEDKKNNKDQSDDENEV